MAQLQQHGWHALGAAREVGAKLPNAFGLHDLHGNVAEWCQDWFDPGSYEKTMPSDPVGPASGVNRVLRGGYWSSRGFSSRSAHRSSLPPSSRTSSYGFRVVRVQ